jgi:pyruvate dehydrogenase complex dehydrogenase (E1) component
VSAEYIAFAALAALAERGQVKDAELADATRRLGIDPSKPDPARSGPAEY